MKTIFEHIEYAKGKPHHVRKQIVFATAGLGTALVAFVWLAGSLSTDAFAIQGSNFADSTGRPAADVDRPSADVAGLAGAASALSDIDSPAHIEIVDTSPATSSGRQSEQTTIPF
ncbi:MAG: hypothetical protein WC798_01245 [Candidatus Paceibacterota bacterium]|jgi:hypothetical protein